jgi:UDP-3-O-[3-hydroxymyristoyl] glucosamine N-acyltransferase
MKSTAEELAKSIGAVLEGDPDLELAGIAAPEKAGQHDLIYVESHKHASRARESKAICVVAGHGIVLEGKTILRAAHPKLAFAKAAEILLGRPTIAAGIHPTAIIARGVLLADKVGVGPYAVIGDEAHIGAGTQIGAHAIIGAGCRLGENCRVHPRVTLYAGVRIGNRTEVHSGAVIGADGFGYASGEGRYWKFPQVGVVEIGDDVEIGANSTIDRGSLGDTRIADGVKLDNLVHIGHNCLIGAHTVIAAQAGLSGSCIFGEHVTVGGQAGFGERCHLENNAVIGGQSGVLGGKTIRGGDPVWGTPARSLAKFKEQFGWLGKLPELAARVKQLENKFGAK